jgi:hypothetical protein
MQESVQNSKTLNLIQFTAAVGLNIIPLVGVFYFHWPVFNIFFYYWANAVIVCIFYAIRLLASGFVKNLVPFIRFALLFSFLLFVFSLIIIALFGPSSFNLFEYFRIIRDGFMENKLSVGYLIVASVISHIYYYAAFRPPRPDYAKSFSQSPYGKITVLYVCLLIGGIAVARLGSVLIPLFLFVVTTSYLDFKEFQEH